MDNEDLKKVSGNILKLNNQIGKQLSVWYSLRNGILYGMGFVIGSIFATSVIISITLHFFSGTVVEEVIRWFAERAG